MNTFACFPISLASGAKILGIIPLVIIKPMYLFTDNINKLFSTFLDMHITKIKIEPRGT